MPYTYTHGKRQPRAETKGMTMDLERVEKIETQIAKMELAYHAASTIAVRESIGNAIDAWNGMLREVKAAR